MPAGQSAFRLGLEPAPQTIGNHETEDTVAEEFETLVRALDGSPTPAATAFGNERARMGQRLLQELAAGELVADDVRERLRRQDARASAQPEAADRNGSRTAISRSSAATGGPTRRSKRR